MKVNSILDLLGAIVLLSALAVVANKPAVLTGGLKGFGDVLKIAKQ